MKVTLVVLVFLFLWPAIIAQERPLRVQLGQGVPEYYKAFQSIDQKQNLTRVVLRNGLTVLIEEFPAAPLASITTMVNAGSLQNPTRPSVSSVIALSKGEALEEAARARGGFSLVGTDTNSTWFTTVIPESEVLHVLSAHANLFTAEADMPLRVETANELVLPEEESAGGLISQEDEQLKEWLGISRQGAPDAALVSEFQQQYFKPSNVTLALSGSIRRENVLPEIVEQFTGLSSEEAEPGEDGAQASPADQGFQYYYSRGDRPGFRVVMAYRIPDADEPALRVLAYLLTEGSAALLKLPQEDGPDDFRPRARIEETPAGTFFLIDSTPSPAEVDGVELRILGLFESLKKGVLPDLALDRAKALFVNDYYRRLEKLSDRSRSLAIQSKTRLQTREEALRRFLNVSRKDIQGVVSRYFGVSNLILSEFASEQSDPRTYAPESYLDALNILLPSATEKQSSFLQIFSAPADSEPFKFSGFQANFLSQNLKRTSILRGPEIYLEEMHTLPLVHLGFFFPGGRITEQTGDAGITELALRSLLNEFERREGSLALAEIEKKGLRYRTTNQKDFFGFQATTISSGIRDAMWTVVTWLREVQVSEEDVEKARRALLRDLELEDESGRKALEADIRQKLFPGHPYSLSPKGTKETIQKISFEQVQDWLSRNVLKTNPSIFLVGDLDGTSFLSEFIKELSDRQYENRSTVKRAVDESLRPGGWPGYAVASDLKTRQLLVGFPGPPEGLFPNQMLDIAGILLGGRAGWLSQEVLEKEGLAERIDFRRSEYINGGALYFHLSGIKSSQLGRNPEKSLLSALSRFSASALERREFLNAMVGAMTRFHHARFGGDEYLRELALAMFAGREPDFRQEYLLSIKQTTPGEVDAALSRYIEVGE